MKTIKIINRMAMIITLSSISHFLFSQEKVSEIHFKNNESKYPKLIVFEADLNKAKKTNLDQKSEFSSYFKTHFNASTEDQFMVAKTQKDSSNNWHKSYSQYHKGIKVAYAQLNVHYNKNNVNSINGLYLPTDTGVLPKSKIDSSMAKSLAVQYFNQIITSDSLIKVFTTKMTVSDGELNWLANGIDNGNLKLCYRFEVKIPGQGQEIFIDAENGNKVFSNQIIYNCVNTQILNKDKATAPTQLISAGSIFETRFSGTKLSVTGYFQNAFYLKDYTRGTGIETYNAYSLGSYKSDGNGNFDISDGGLGTNSMPQTDYKDSDNYWNYNKTAIEKSDAALDVHLYTQNFYDYFKKTFNRNSIDNKGKKLESYVNLWGNIINDPKIPAGLYDYFVKNQAAVNAYWDGMKMVYYFGNNVTYDPLCTQDIVAHELGHGFCQNTANLIYSNESGALNEALSDIWGATIENSFYGNTKKTWGIGEEADLKYKVGLRNMANPNMFGQPDTYRGNDFHRSILFDNGGVHINSGVINYWFYLLSEGGKGKNDVGYNFNVNKIGMATAAKIVYNTENNYLTPTSDFADFRLNILQTTINYYGKNSEIYKSVVEAFNAVNILEVPFKDIPCSSSHKSRNDPSEYAWITSICNPNATGPINSNIQSGNYISKNLFLPSDFPCPNQTFSNSIVPAGGKVLLESANRISIKSFRMNQGSSFRARQCINYRNL